MDGATVATIAVPVVVAVGAATWHRVSQYRKATHDVAESVGTLSTFLFGHPRDEHTGAPRVVGWTERVDATLERIEGAASVAAAGAAKGRVAAELEVEAQHTERQRIRGREQEVDERA